MSDQGSDISEDEIESNDEEIEGELFSERELRSEGLDVNEMVSSFIEELLPRELTKEEASKCLCLLGKTASGLEHAYLMLKATSMKLTNIKIITSFPHVMFVDVSGNRLDEEALSVLEPMEFLLMLKVDENRLKTAKFPTMPYLQVLTFNRNEITSLSGIEHPLLECLELKNNNIKEADGLDPLCLQNLKVLELRANSLFTTGGILIPTLQRLYLAENLIQKIEGLELLVNLEVLHLRDNPISNLNGFSDSLISLRYVNLRSCDIKTISEVKKLAVLPKLETIVVMDNPSSGEEEEDYRIELIVAIKTLKRIDKTPIQDEEYEEADEIRAEQEGEENEEEEEPQDDDEDM